MNGMGEGESESEREKNSVNAFPLQLEKYRINWCWPYWNAMECL